MTNRITIRVGLHTTASGKTLSVYRASLSLEGIETDEQAIEYVRTRINNDWGLNRGALLNCIDNNDYLITREVA